MQQTTGQILAKARTGRGGPGPPVLGVLGHVTHPPGFRWAFVEGRGGQGGQDRGGRGRGPRGAETHKTPAVLDSEQKRAGETKTSGIIFGGSASSGFFEDKTGQLGGRLGG